MKNILFLHDTYLNTPRGAELTLKELIELGKEKGYQVEVDGLKHFHLVKEKIETSDIVIVSSTSRCDFELQLIAFLISGSKPYIKVEFDYNFCIRRNILCTVDRKIRSCCHNDKFHLFRKLFAKSSLNVFQSPKHYQSHYEFYGEAIANHLIMPPTVQIDRLNPVKQKDKTTIPFFGDLNYLKGGHEYVSYAEEHPELYFKVYGRNRLRRQMPNNMSFHEPVANDKVLEILGKTETIFCQPVWPEPSGRLAAEAFLSGCNIIANDRIGTFSFEFYPNDKHQAIQEIKEASENFWDAVDDILSNQTDVVPQTLGKVLVYKSYGGLGDIFFAIPAIYKLAKVSDTIEFAVAPRLVSFFSKYLKIKIVSETSARENEDEYDNIYELGNYPAFRGYDLPHALKYPTHKKVKQHAIQHYIDTISKLHIDIDNRLEGYPYFKRNINTEKPYFVVHHGAGFLLKIWPTDKYAKLIEQLRVIYPKLGCKIIQGPDDPDIKKYFGNEMSHVEIITGGMVDVGNALSGAMFHIGNDAGITHVAGSFNVPTVGIYGPTGPGSWGSFAEHNELIWGKKGVCDVRCNYDVILSCEHKICLNSITVNRVLVALFKVLQGAFNDHKSVLKINPEAKIVFENGDCLVKVNDNDMLIECHSKSMENDLKLIFTNEMKMGNLDEDMEKVVEVLKQQEVLFEIPCF